VNLYQLIVADFFGCVVVCVLANDEHQARDLIKNDAAFQEVLRDYTSRSIEQAFAKMKVLDKPGVLVSSFSD